MLIKHKLGRKKYLNLFPQKATTKSLFPQKATTKSLFPQKATKHLFPPLLSLSPPTFSISLPLSLSSRHTFSISLLFLSVISPHFLRLSPLSLCHLATLSPSLSSFSLSSRHTFSISLLFLSLPAPRPSLSPLSFRLSVSRLSLSCHTLSLLLSLSLAILSLSFSCHSLSLLPFSLSLSLL